MNKIHFVLQLALSLLQKEAKIGGVSDKKPNKFALYFS